MYRFHCASLDNISNSNLMYVAYITDAHGDESCWFYGSKEFADYIAGLVYRAHVHETVEVDTSYDYAVGAAYVNEWKDVSNGYTEEFHSVGPQWPINDINLPGVLNHLVQCYMFDESWQGTTVGWREFEILLHLCSYEIKQNDERDIAIDFYDHTGDGFQLHWKREGDKVIFAGISG